MSNRQLRLSFSNLALCFFYESEHNNLFLVSPIEISEKTATKEKKNQQKTQCYYKRLINKKRILFVVTFCFFSSHPFQEVPLDNKNICTYRKLKHI